MKTRLLAIAMLLCTFAAKAQYVTIPDPAFALFLQQTYPNCMNGNQMDTTCSDIVSTTDLYCSHLGIADLDGAQYFDSLQSLDCSFNELSYLPFIPANLIHLNCDNNNLSTLPTLSNSLENITCGWNNITMLPPLPDSLQIFYCTSNLIASLPALPENLYLLDCSYNPLTSLPIIPDSLKELICEYAMLTTLPALPNNLERLYVNYNSLGQINSLPDSLLTLSCDSNNLQSLPTLPSKLAYLSFAYNSLNTLPSLPSGLNTLNCSYNPISSLLGLPTGLGQLNCSGTYVSPLPTLPNGLSSLHCSDINLGTLPALPPTLLSLICHNIRLTLLPPLPANLRTLMCNNNPQLTFLPDMPQLKYLSCINDTGLVSIGNIADTLNYLYLNNCVNLKCLPAFKHVTSSLVFTNTDIACLPNSITVGLTSNPPFNSLPICNPINNVNGCALTASITGHTYADRNNNCNFDGTDVGQYGLKHNLYSNSILLEQTYSNEVGTYSFNETGLGNFETRLDTTDLPFTIACPTGGVYYDTLTANDSTHFNRDFALQCETGFDLAAYSVASNMIFRPANNTTVDVHAGDLANFYHASCAQGVSGTVTVKLHGPISYIAPANGAVAPSNVSNNVLTWNVADFGTADALHDFNIVIQTDTFAQSGQQACFEVNVTPLVGDNDTTNNYLYFCFDIVNSYDPNDKTAYPSGNIDTTQEWLTYRVRFQNTGTAEAQHIYIMDTLDANVQVETFQLLSYSHQPNVQIKENIVRFNFPFINLPDSNTNEPGSHGYVQYKVKLKEDLPIGTAINNTAYIYFDFNPPVVTNTATNTIAVEEDTVEVGIKGIQRDMGIVLYPNPANSQVTVSGNAPLYSITIYDIVGRIRLGQNVSGTSATIDISNLPSGLYVVGTGSSNKRLRLVKQ